MNPHSLSVGPKLCSGAAIRRLKPLAAVMMMAGLLGPCVSGLAQTPGAEVSVTGAAGPRIEFAEAVFDFGRVKQGELVRREFVFKNTGTAMLEITDVHPGCGCTTAGNWDRRVEPGRIGIIPLQLNSTGFSGEVNKSATVTCNDPRQPTVNLQIKGIVQTPFSVTPTLAVFTVSSETESSETKVVRIVSNSVEPVTLFGVEGAKPSLRGELTTVKPGREFELKITAVPPFTSSSVSAPLMLKTSSTEVPTITVLAQLIVQPPVVAVPDRITLPGGPLPVMTNYFVTVRNHGKNALVLSDARINVPGAVVSVQEVQPAKMFQVTVTFPAGFEPKPEEIVEVSLKSNHPKYAVIRVPVVAAPRPVAQPKVTAGKSPASTSLVAIAAPREDTAKK